MCTPFLASSLRRLGYSEPRGKRSHVGIMDLDEEEHGRCAAAGERQILGVKMEEYASIRQKRTSGLSLSLMPPSGFSRLVRATPEVYALHTHWYKEQITGIYRMDWRDDHGTEATAMQRSRIEESWRDPGRYRPPSPPVRSLRQRVDACRTALFPPSRTEISSGLLVVSERL